jgi:hypothetical protein
MNKPEEETENNNIGYCGYVHFDKVEECDAFVKYIENKQIEITHRCCNGLGCGIKDYIAKNINTIHLKKEYLDF